MKNKKGYTFIELTIVIIILGIISIATVSSLSYAFDDKRLESYNEQINLMINKAETYGETVKDDIKDTQNGIVVTAEELIEKGYLGANDDGLITDPRNESNNLNNIRIRITYNEKNDSVKAEVVD